LDKICRKGVSIMPGLIVLGSGLIVLGVALIVVPLVAPSAWPKIKKGLKGANQWRKDNNLKTHQEFKKELKQAQDKRK
jgi:hypothetical protein